jgi:enterobacterial common antigen flippase
VQESSTGPQKSSYGQILKSTALIGSSSVLNIAIGILRSKAIALILGPSGVGLNGMYGSITNLAEAIVGIGINSSGVRQIADAAGSNDQVRIAKTAAVLRRTALILGLIGATILVIFSRQISSITFGTTEQTVAICILSLSVLFRLVAVGQGALLQGLRRISDISRVAVLTSVGGTILTIVLVYLLGNSGVAISVVASTAVGLALSWWFSKGLAADALHVTPSEVRIEATALLQLGLTLMVSGLVTVGCSYVIRTAIFRQLGAGATGLYQAAWTVGGLYVGFILQAMGSDFYPRLTAVACDDAECNRLVNEQAYVSLLLAGTGVIGTLTFAPLVIDIFYASSFRDAVDLLRWICLGAALQVVSWPMGFIIVAKGEKGKLLWSELAWAALHLGLAWVSLQYFGLSGIGIAYFGSYVFHIALTYFMAYRLTRFSWSKETRNATLAYLALIGAIFVGIQVLPSIWAMVLGMVVVIVVGVYSIQTLLKLISFQRVPSQIQQVLASVVR